MSPATACPPAQPLFELIDVVDLKWLLGLEGCHIQCARVQSDPGYARECLDRAAQGRTQAVREVARRLQAQLAAREAEAARD